MSDEPVIVELLPSGKRKVWVCSDRQVYKLWHVLIASGRGVQEAFDLLPTRITGGIVSYTLPRAKRVDGTKYFQLIEEKELPAMVAR